MGFKLKVEGPSTIELGTTIITGVKFRTDIPHDSNAAFDRYGKHGDDHWQDLNCR